MRSAKGAKKAGKITQDPYAWVKNFYKSKGGLHGVSVWKQDELTRRLKRKQHKRIPGEDEDGIANNINHLDDGHRSNNPHIIQSSKPQALIKSVKGTNNKSLTTLRPPDRDWDKWFARHSHPQIIYTEAELPARNLITSKNVYLLMRVKPHAPDLIRDSITNIATPTTTRRHRQDMAIPDIEITGTGVVVGFKIFRKVAKEGEHVVKGHEKLAARTSTFQRGDAPVLEMCARVEWDEWGPGCPQIQNCYIGKCKIFQLEKAVTNWSGKRANKLKSLKSISNGAF